MEGFVERFKQRKLVQWAVAYVAFAFALIQIADVVAGSYHWPDHVMHVVFGLLVLGFVVTLILAWYHGERGAQKVSGPELLLIALVLMVGGGSLWYFGRLNPPVAVSNATVTTQVAASAKPAPVAPASFNPPADTLVVLPFQNLSGDPKQQFFSDGITEELTDALGQNPALRVIAWDTASKYRNSSESALAVGKTLNVAHILHGSIEREGDAVRITTELVDTRTNYQLWSQHYDDSFAKIFKVQDQVSEAIAKALQVKFAQADLPEGGTKNPEAHELVLRGRALADKYDAVSIEAARKDFEQAIALDPDYADAHAELAVTLNVLTERSDLSFKNVLPQIRAEAGQALALDPRNTTAMVALGLADISADPPQIAEAENELSKVLKLDPSYAVAQITYGLMLPLKLGLAEELKAARLDPEGSVIQFNLAFYYQDLGDWADMLTATEAMIRLDPANVDGAFMLAFARQHLHQYDGMVQAFDLVKPATPLDRQQVDTGRLVYRAVVTPELRPQALAAIKDLSRHQSNSDVADNLLVMYASLDERVALLQLLENYCPDNPLFCNDISAGPWYAALHHDPRFEALVKKYDIVSKSP